MQDLIDLSASIDQTEVSLGSRGGFDTIAIASEFDVSGLIFDDTFTVTPPTATAYGAWGEQGFAVNPPEWANLPLTNGSFTFGTLADDNYVAGNFHGLDHEEAYGVFDTESYTGAFGAKRDN